MSSLVALVCVFAALLCLLRTASCACADTWSQNGTKCYKIVNTNGGANYWTSTRLCESFGGQLAEPRTREINAFLTELLPHLWGNMFLGGSDIATEGTWVWADNTPMDFTDWRASEPNNLNGEDCMRIEWDGGWTDVSCYDTTPFAMCQLPAKKQWLTITTVTSDITDANTNADIYAVITGSEKTGSSVILHKLQYDAFERGRTDVFTIEYDKVGEPIKIDLSMKSDSADWHLKTVTVADVASGREYAHTCDCWFGKARGTKSRLIPLTFIQRFIVTTYTSNITDAETTSQITVLISGSEGPGSNTVLDVPYYAEFQRGATDTFEISPRRSGVPDTIELTVTSSSEDWHLTQVTVKDLTSGQLYGVRCDCWIGQARGSLTRILKLEAWTEYSIMVATSDINSGGTMSDVTIELVGNLTSSLTLRMPEAGFTRGSIKLFTMPARDVGHVVNVTITLSDISDAWHLEIATVRNDISRSQFAIPCRCWIPYTNPDTGMTISSSTVNAHQYWGEIPMVCLPPHNQVVTFDSESYVLFDAYTRKYPALRNAVYWAGVEKGQDNLIHPISNLSHVVSNATLDKWKISLHSQPDMAGMCGTVRPNDKDELVLTTCEYDKAKVLCATKYSHVVMSSSRTDCLPTWTPPLTPTISDPATCLTQCQTDPQCLGVSISVPQCLMYSSSLGSKPWPLLSLNESCTCEQNSGWTTTMKFIIGYEVGTSIYQLDYCDASTSMQPVIKPPGESTRTSIGTSETSSAQASTRSYITKTTLSTIVDPVSMRTTSSGPTSDSIDTTDTFVSTQPPPQRTTTTAPTTISATTHIEQTSTPRNPAQSTIKFVSSSDITSTTVSSAHIASTNVATNPTIIASSTHVTSPYIDDDSTSVTITTPLYASTDTTSENIHKQTTVTQTTSPNTTHTSTMYTRDLYCSCACINHHPPSNQTTQQKHEFISSLLANMTLISPTNSTRYRLSKISVVDDRPSSTGIGVIGGVLLATVGVLIVVSDAALLVRHVIVAIGNIKSFLGFW